MNLRYLAVSVVSLLVASPSFAATWTVASSGGDATTIQGGIDLAANGDVVVVAAGTYAGAGNLNISFNGKAITVMSQSGPYVTFIDCQGAGRAFVFENNEGAGSVVEGFTMMNGSSTQGGAIYVDDCSPTIRFNIFKSNTASSAGGAIYLRKGSSTLYNNTLDGNSAPAGGGIALRGPIGGQIYQNVISGSTAGGGIACVTGPSTTVMTCNDVWGNTGGNTTCGTNGGNNFAMDPLFCGIIGSGNFFLQQTSPLTVTYSPCGAAVGALPVACTVTATNSATWGTVKSMYR